jgi:hypothetical protein
MEDINIILEEISQIHGSKDLENCKQNLIKDLKRSIADTLRSNETISKARKLYETISKKLFSEYGAKLEYKVLHKYLKQIQCALSLCKIMESKIKIEFPTANNDTKKFSYLFHCIFSTFEIIFFIKPK